MTKMGARVSDVLLLEKLEEQIGSSGKAMANIDQNVCNYVNDVRDNLERQLDTIHGRLQEAEQKLEEAENALSSCHTSQVLDPLTGTFVPSCDWEESAVESARAEVETWRTKYEQGQQILGECQREIGEYFGPGGGHSLILTMCEQQTPKAIRILRGCIDKLQDILSSDMVLSANLGADSEPKAPDSPASEEGHVNDLKNFFNL